MDRAADTVATVNIGTDGVWQNPQFNSAFCHRKAQAGGAMPNVQTHAA
ncbi:hypothetical protein SDC9_191239 [bioreactor metagenome]|uniref:Uncharacterized protein n=1 Tax=bioreactor metagenome TaxID=1076179 RepID=A0A645HZR1_9ZZZZ